ncbi:hypothetical protein WAI453_004155 [Rhynchosporium graminicola]
MSQTLATQRKSGIICSASTSNGEFTSQHDPSFCKSSPLASNKPEDGTKELALIPRQPHRLHQSHPFRSAGSKFFSHKIISLTAHHLTHSISPPSQPTHHAVHQTSSLHDPQHTNKKLKITRLEHPQLFSSTKNSFKQVRPTVELRSGADGDVLPGEGAWGCNCQEENSPAESLKISSSFGAIGIEVFVSVRKSNIWALSDETIKKRSEKSVLMPLSLPSTRSLPNKNYDS